MPMPRRDFYATSSLFSHFVLFLLIGIPARAQWTAADASGNIDNNNTGLVVVKSADSNAGNLFYGKCDAGKPRTTHRTTGTFREDRGPVNP
jgi:hypothetical protein